MERPTLAAPISTSRHRSCYQPMIIWYYHIIYLIDFHASAQHLWHYRKICHIFNFLLCPKWIYLKAVCHKFHIYIIGGLEAGNQFIAVWISMFAHVGFSGLSWALSQSLAGKSDQFLQFSLWLKCVLLPVFSSVSINPTSRWRPCNQSHPKISPAWEFSPYYTLLKDLHFWIKIRDLLEGPIGGEPLRCDGLGAGVCARPAEHHLRAVRLGFWQCRDFWGADGPPVEDQSGHHWHLARSALEHWRQRWGDPSWNHPSLRYNCKIDSLGHLTKSLDFVSCVWKKNCWQERYRQDGVQGPEFGWNYPDGLFVGKVCTIIIVKTSSR